MEILNYKEFRKNLTQSLDNVHDNAEVLIVSRSKRKNVVIMSLEEYNSLNETLYLISSKLNKKRLDEAIEEMEKGNFCG